MCPTPWNSLCRWRKTATTRRTGQIISSDSLYYNADRSTTQELQNFDNLKGTDKPWDISGVVESCCHLVEVLCVAGGHVTNTSHVHLVTMDRTSTSYWSFHKASAKRYYTSFLTACVLMLSKQQHHFFIYFILSPFFRCSTSDKCDLNTHTQTHTPHIILTVFSILSPVPLLHPDSQIHSSFFHPSIALGVRGELWWSLAGCRPTVTRSTSCLRD